MIDQICALDKYKNLQPQSEEARGLIDYFVGHQEHLVKMCQEKLSEEEVVDCMMHLDEVITSLIELFNNGCQFI